MHAQLALQEQVQILLLVMMEKAPLVKIMLLVIGLLIQLLVHMELVLLEIHQQFAVMVKVLPPDLVKHLLIVQLPALVKVLMFAQEQQQKLSHVKLGSTKMHYFVNLAQLVTVEFVLQMPMHAQLAKMVSLKVELVLH
jgi:hypothetical protein